MFVLARLHYTKPYKPTLSTSMYDVKKLVLKKKINKKSNSRYSKIPFTESINKKTALLIFQKKKTAEGSNKIKFNFNSLTLWALWIVNTCMFLAICEF